MNFNASLIKNNKISPLILGIFTSASKVRILFSSLLFSSLLLNSVTFAVPTTGASNLVPKNSVKRCCMQDTPIPLQGQCSTNQFCNGQECTDDKECPKRRCEDSSCVVSREGLLCTDENCNENHPPRCALKDFTTSDGKQIKAGQCTLQYEDKHLESVSVGQSCNADYCDLVAQHKYCYTGMGLCLPLAWIPDVSNVGERCDGPNENFCKESESWRFCDVKGKCKPIEEFSLLEVKFGRCTSDKVCVEGGIRTCVEGKCVNGKGGDKLCTKDEHCEKGVEIHFCSGDGKCIPESECQKDGDKCGRETCPPGELGDAFCGEFRTCQKGFCVRGYLRGGTSTLGYNYDNYPCNSVEDCKLKDVKICFDQKCQIDKRPIHFVDECQTDNNCSIGEKYCNKWGVCTTGSGFICRGCAKCKDHAECESRGYPRYDPNNTPIIIGQKGPNNQDQTTARASIKPESLKLSPEKDQLLAPAEAVREMSKVTPSFVFGKSEAKVSLALFQDLSCGQCARAYRDSFSELQSKYIDSGKLKVAFYEFPLIMSNKKDVERHYAALCSGEQGKYREFVEQLYGNFKEYEQKGHEHYAKSIAGLDLTKWKTCMTNTAPLTAKILNQKQLGEKLGVVGTPTLFLNGKDTSNFRDELLAAVAQATK